MSGSIRVHSIIPVSEANGPGRRYVLWFQGCSIRCPGCANPETWNSDDGEVYGPDSIAEAIRSSFDKGEIDGVTISGGEPLDQWRSLWGLLRQLPVIPVILFTGHHLSDVRGLFRDIIEQQLVDVIVAGPYVQGRPRGFGLCSTDNQSMIYVTDRYSYKDFLNLPQAEVIVQPDGRVIETGTFVEVKG